MSSRARSSGVSSLAEPAARRGSAIAVGGRAKSRAGSEGRGAARDAAASSRDRTWSFTLYVAGDSPKSRAALSNLQRLCEQYLPGAHDIEIVDLKQRPELAKSAQIFAVPTLVRAAPTPEKRVIGDLSDRERALLALELDISASSETGA